MKPRTPRPIRVDGDLAYIPLTQGREAIIDAADVPLVRDMHWRVQKSNHTAYAKATPASRKSVLLHRLLIGALPGQIVDHANGDGLDNRRANIRLATYAENLRNCRRPLTNRSGVKGVHWASRNKKWMAQIKKDGKSTYLGLYSSKEEAGAAYAKASAELHGEFGRV